MSDLPKGWVRVRLDEVAEVRLGRQRSPKNHTGTHMRPYLRAANVGWDGLKLGDVKEMNFTDQEAQIYRLQPGDIVLSEASGSPDEVGKPAIWNGELDDCCFQNTLIRVRSHGPDPRYLLHFLRHEALRGAFAERSRGVGIHHLGAARLAALPIVLPPLAEQGRIVAVLEEYLSRLERSVELIGGSLQRTQEISSRLLNDSVSDSADKMIRASLGDVATSVRNGMFVSRPTTLPEGTPILRIGAVRPLFLDLSDLRYTGRAVESVRAQGYLLEAGDLVFTRYNGNPDYVGACAVVPSDTGPLTYPDKLIRVSVDRSRAVPEFVAMACSTGQARAVIRAAVRTTAGQTGIAGRDLKRIPLFLPTLEEQRRRARTFQDQTEDIKRIVGQLNSALQKANGFRRSILHQAVTGTLVLQDPKDEPTSWPLSRLENERRNFDGERRAKSRNARAKSAQGRLL